MRIFNTAAYAKYLHRHFEDHFDADGTRFNIADHNNQLHKHFYVLEIPPNKRHNMYAYCTVGMSADRLDDNLTELFVYSPVASHELVEVLVRCATYHRNKLPLKTHQAIEIGQPWLENSQCDHAFVSLPYLDGKKLELFRFDGHIICCHWLIPITELEREYRLKYGHRALEKLFLKNQVDYLDPGRKCLVTGE